MDKSTSLIIVSDAAYEQGYLTRDHRVVEIHDPAYVWESLEDKDVYREVQGKW